jgi:hypothetical protein
MLLTVTVPVNTALEETGTTWAIPMYGASYGVLAASSVAP